MMSEVKNKDRLNQLDFVESVILKVKKHESRQKQKRVLLFSMAMFGFVSLITMQLAAPINNESQLTTHMDDQIKRELLNHHMNFDNSAHYAFNAGKMELCLKYFKCNGG